MRSVYEILSQRWPGIAAELAGRPAVTQTHANALKFRGRSMQSSRPEIEARRLVDRRFGDALPAEVVLSGHGTGPMCAELLRRGVRRLRVIAPDADWLQTALANWTEPELLAHPSLELELPGRTAPGLPAGALIEHPACLRAFPWEMARIRVALEKSRSSDLRLKILVVEPFYGGSLPIAGYAARAFRELGHQVRQVSYAGMAEAWRTLSDAGERLQDAGDLPQRFTGLAGELALHEAAAFRPDLVFVLAQAPLPPVILERMRSLGMRVVFWFVEDYQTMTYWKAIHEHTDLFLTIQRGEFLQQLGGRGHAAYLPLCTEPSVFHPQPQDGLDHELTFVGAGYHNRETTFLQLRRQGLKIWGGDWNPLHPAWEMVQEEGRRTNDEDNRSIFSNSRINLNLHSSTYHEGVDPAGDFVNPRTFDILACGGFQLCDERSLLSELLEPGRHLDTFRDAEELKERVAYYREHPEEARAMAEAGRAHVLRYHTFRRRMEECLELALLRDPDWFPAAVRRDEERALASDPQLRRLLETLPPEVEPSVDGISAWLERRGGRLDATEGLFLYMARIKDWARSKNIDRMLEARPRG